MSVVILSGGIAELHPPFIVVVEVELVLLILNMSVTEFTPISVAATIIAVVIKDSTVSEPPSFAVK